jgi:branched-chain amino acid transport system substrate-binding protein
MMRVTGRILAAALLLASLAAQAALAQDKVKIGFIATFSGPGGVLGQHLYDGFMLGVDHSGGKLGGLAVEVIKEDDQLKPDVGLLVAKKLMERDKVDVIAGVIFSNVMMAIYKPVIDAGLPLISSNAGPSPIAGSQCSPMFFSTSWQNDGAHEAMGKHVQDKGFKNVYLMAPNYQAGKDALEGFKRFYKGKVVDEVYTTVNQLDYSAEIAQLRAAKPDAIYVFYPGGMGVNFVKQYAQAGLVSQIPMFSAFTIDSTTLPAQGDAAIGTFQTAFWAVDLKNPVNEKFVADHRKKHNDYPSTYSAQAYDTALLLNAAIKDSGGKVDDKKALAAALKKASFDSVRGGKFRLNTNNIPIQNFYLLETVKGADGKLVSVNRATVLTDHKDAYAKDCPMK